MAKITTPDKTTGQPHTAAEYNAFKASINAAYDKIESTTGTYGTGQMTFDSIRKVITHTQTSILNLSLAASGNVDGNQIHLIITGNGQAINVSGDFIGEIKGKEGRIDIFLLYQSGKVLVAVHNQAVASGAATDTTAPGYLQSTPSVTLPTTNGFTVNAALNEPGTVYFVVLADAATAPNSQQVKLGQNAAGGAGLASGSITVSQAETLYTSVVNTLTSQTAYDVWFAAEDANGNLQANPSKVDVSTASGVDTTAPVLQSVATNGTGSQTVLTYNESLNTGSIPAPSDFAYSGSVTGVITITSVSVDGIYVRLNHAAVEPTETLTLNYTADVNPIQDLAATPNNAAAISNQAVVNNRVANSGSSAAFNNGFLYRDAAPSFNFSDPAGDLPFSISAWVKRDNNANTVYLLGYESRNSTKIRQYRALVNINGAIVLELISITDLGNYLHRYSVRTGDGEIPPETWSHITFTYTGNSANGVSISNFKIYVNGVETSINGTLHNQYTRLATTAGLDDLLIGFSLTNRNQVGSFIDNIAVFSKALSNAEVVEAYAGGALIDFSQHSASANLLGWWSFDTDLLVDDSGNGNTLTAVQTTQSTDIP